MILRRHKKQNINYEDLSYAELKHLVSEKGLEIKSKKKDDIIAELLKLEEK